MTGFDEAARAAAHAAHPSLSDADVQQALSRVHDRLAEHLDCPHCGSIDIDRGATGLHMCRRCGGLFRDQAGRLAALPLLTGEELDELGEAVGGLLRHLLISTPAPQLAMSRGLQHRIAVLNSLATAIAETRGALR